MTEPFIALSVSDILPFDILAERISYMSGIRSECPSFSRVCVRNDSFDPEMFRAAAEAVSDAGFGLVLESAEAVCISYENGNPVAVPGDDVQSLVDNAALAEGAGARSVVLSPAMRNMKSALETCTDIGRLGREDSRPRRPGP